MDNTCEFFIGDRVFVSNNDTEYEEIYGKRTHRNFIGTIVGIHCSTNNGTIDGCHYDDPDITFMIDFDHDNTIWAYNKSEVSSVEELYSMTLKEICDKYDVDINATYRKDIYGDK